MAKSLTDAQRRRAVSLVVSLTANTSLAPQQYERHLFDQLESGEITRPQLADLLNACVHQVLYHSHAAGQPSEAELADLLLEARRYNASQGITGLLLYSDGRYVQVLEGGESAVEDLYARIQHDPRHTQVVTRSRGRSPRRFAEWSMAFGHVSAGELDPALAAALASLPASPAVTDPRLRTLLQFFMPD